MRVSCSSCGDKLDFSLSRTLGVISHVSELINSHGIEKSSRGLSPLPLDFGLTGGLRFGRDKVRGRVNKGSAVQRNSSLNHLMCSLVSFSSFKMLKK